MKKYQAATYLGLAQGQDLDVAAESFMNNAIVSVSDKVELKISKDKRRLAYAAA